MAKYRHRIFEMYEFHDEAARELMPQLAHPATKVTAPESWTFKQLAVSRSVGVTRVEFKVAQVAGEEIENDLRQDFALLGERLVKDSKVLIDFTGVTSFSAASIGLLVQLNQVLQIKGSRLALCCLAPAVHQSFFEKKNRAAETSMRRAFSHLGHPA